MRNTFFALLLFTLLYWILCMCLSPISKPNPNFMRGVPASPMTITYPCGQCCECKQAQSNSWAIRSVVETNRCLSHNGIVVFTTLTFKPKYVPYMYYAKDGQELRISTWNSKHYKNLFKKIRRHIESQFYSDYEKPSKQYSLKYALFKERGETDLYVDDHGRSRRGQHLPHAHFICWFSPANGFLPVNSDGDTLNHSYFFNLIQRKWSHYDRHHHKYSTLGRAYNEALARTVNVAAKYTAKYASKTFYSRDLMELMPNFVRHSDGLDCSKDMLPRCQVSKGLGWSKSFIDTLVKRDFPVQDIQSGKVKRLNTATPRLIDSKIPNLWDTREEAEPLPLPSYYNNKLLKRTFTRKDSTLLHLKDYQDMLCREIKHAKDNRDLERLPNLVQELNDTIKAINSITPKVRHKRAALIDGKYIPAHTETLDEWTESKTFNSPLYMQVNEQRIQSRIRDIVPELLSFCSRLYDGDIPLSALDLDVSPTPKRYVDANTLYEWKQARKAAESLDIDTCLSVLSRPIGDKYLYYCFTHFPICASTSVSDKHLSKVDALRQLLSIYEVEKRINNILLYENNRLNYLRNLPEKSQKHPELFEPRLINGDIDYEI